MVALSRIFNIHTDYTVSKNRMEDSMARISSSDRFITPGNGLGGNLAFSEKLRYRIQTGEQSRNSIQNGITYIDQADFSADTVTSILQRMSELAAVSLNPTIVDAERAPIDVEYQALKDEVSRISRDNLIFDKQTVGRDALLSFDSVNNRLHFYQANGGDEGVIKKDFDIDELDPDQNYIGFDSSRDYTMSRDGRSLFYIGETTQGSGAFVAKKYNMDTGVVQAGTDAFTATDKMFVDEEANLYINSGNTVYDLDTSSLARTATAVVDIATDTQFSVYKGIINYFDTADQLVQYDINAATSTTLIADTTTVVGGQPAVFATGGVDHAISSSGRYIADEVAPGTIRLMDSDTDTGTVINIGAANTVDGLHFNEDEDRLYYVNQASNEISYVTFDTERGTNTVTMSLGSTVVQGTTQLRFDSIDLGGTNFNSIVPFGLAEDTTTILEYESADLRLYNLGLLESSVETAANADQALVDVADALNTVNFERAKLGATGRRLRHVLDSHMNYLADMRDAESHVRDVDIAKESGTLAQLQVRNQAAIAMVTQFNASKEAVLRLLN
ncbi:hypothetical protein SCG7109_AB_00130 [Chlamydiales bacterium SCGC AG-110-M15]|nr:hypothetical protein SCG7109_AB_00130 [Chlamydiales bacterium SCGC AG-110-M15]